MVYATAAASSASHKAGAYIAIGAFCLLILLPLLAKIGDVIPGLLCLATGVTAVFVVPPTMSVSWQIFLIFVLPFLVAAVYKGIRGDTKATWRRSGTKGNRLP